MYEIKDYFIDEVTNDNNSSHIGYYENIAKYIFELNPNAVIIWNPGTVFSDKNIAYSYLKISGVWTVFEGDYNSYNSFTFPSWIKNYPQERFLHLVYGADTEEKMLTAVNKSKNNNAGYVYITNDALPNPWDTIPSYFQSEIKAARNCAFSQ